MSGPSVALLFTVPVSVAVGMVFSEEMWRAVVWLRSFHIGRVVEELMPAYLGLTLPSGRVVRLMPLPTARDNEE